MRGETLRLYLARMAVLALLGRSLRGGIFADVNDYPIYYAARMIDSITAVAARADTVWPSVQPILQTWHWPWRTRSA